MDNMKVKLGQGGLLIAGISIISIILSLFNYNIRLLDWIEVWGTTVGWAIRIFLIIGGGALFIFYGKEDELY